MSPDPIKCPKCGSTQIGGGRTGSRVSGAMLMEDSPLVPVLHSGGQFLNTCMACGYEWSPAAKAAERAAEAAERAERKRLAGQLSLFNPWRKTLLEKLSPILGDDKNEFSKWLMEHYREESVAFLERPADKLPMDSHHPWLKYQLARGRNENMAPIWMVIIYLLCLIPTAWICSLIFNSIGVFGFFVVVASVGAVITFTELGCLGVVICLLFLIPTAWICSPFFNTTGLFLVVASVGGVITIFKILTSYDNINSELKSTVLQQLKSVHLSSGKRSAAGPIKKKSTKAYNTEQEGIIASMVESGSGVKEIAEAVGKTQASVRGKLLSMDLKAPQRSQSTSQIKQPKTKSGGQDKVKDTLLQFDLQPDEYLMRTHVKQPKTKSGGQDKVKDTLQQLAPEELQYVTRLCDQDLIEQQATPVTSKEATTASSKPSSGRSPTLFFVKDYLGDVVRQLSSSELRTAVANGEFAPYDLIRKSEKDKWTKLSEVKGLDFPNPS
jgi:predicted transcriptional regulator